MLRLWRDSVHIAIYRDAAVLARIPRGLRRSIQASHTERPDNTAGGGLAALEAALQDHRWHGADATVLVSNALVRYSLMTIVLIHWHDMALWLPRVAFE